MNRFTRGAAAVAAVGVLAGAGARALKKEKRGFTRIAGTVLKYYRSARGFTQGDLAEKIDRETTRVSKAEGGESRLRFFRETIGDIGHYLELGSAEIVVFMSALWVDELLADLVALTQRRDVEKRSSCFALLQWLWYHPEAQAWLKVIFFANPSPQLGGSGDRGVACLARHAAFPPHRPVMTVLANAPYHTRNKGGAVPEMPEDALDRSLLFGADAMERLTKAVRIAQTEAIAALRKPRSPESSPKVADMLLLFADLAKGEAESCAELRGLLAELDDNALSLVDRRYRARALYLLGDDDALCNYVTAADVSETQRAWILSYYAERAADDGDGTLTLQSLCSHLEFARTKKSAPLLAMYLRTIDDLIASNRTPGGWATALGNLSTTRALVRELDRIQEGASEGGAATRAVGCEHDPSCTQLAMHSVDRIRDAIKDARRAIGIDGPL